ncbi:polyprenyl synthetase family protein [Streptomyces sp. Qhu-G9]|uniref:polyprenyl synthetase family protein n=1 Tax=Streptomyces sp. Qhu-G9 TaxID=3452799 RepID=UPI0022ABF3D9|nr:polyprenyl synthetase family protein [Streptomyces aurantiacus]WAU82670.1 polyprenyl synthetase family protein [Streptomyces aurantiacus]
MRVTTQELIAAPVPDLLACAQELVRPVLNRTVADMHPELRRICGYHFGWSQQDGSAVDKPPQGKALRSALVLLSAAAYGDNSAPVLEGAAAMELVHNSTMMHDDVMDGDEMRRGRPAVWAVYGIAWALLAGDALWVAANRCLQAVGRPDTLGLLGDASSALVNGQGGELHLASREVAGIGLEEYTAMAAGKTSALLECALGIGAALGGAGKETVTELRFAGHHLGIAWQAANDIEDIWADPAVTGKPPMGDLRERKPTLPMIAALHSGGPHAQALAHAVRDRELWPEPHELAALIEKAGGRSGAAALSNRHLAESLSHLDRAVLHPAADEAMRRLFRFIVTRG